MNDNRRYKPFLILGGIVLFLLFIICATGLYGKEKRFQLHGKINEKLAEKFRLFLVNVNSADTVVMHIESDGGYARSMNKIIYLMKKSQASFECTADSHANSAAGIILFNCDNIHMAPIAELMIHMYQVCDLKKSKEKCHRVPANEKEHPYNYAASIKALSNIFKYLTEEEKKKVISGEDLTLRGYDVMQRLNNQ